MTDTSPLKCGVSMVLMVKRENAKLQPPGALVLLNRLVKKSVAPSGPCGPVESVVI